MTGVLVLALGGSLLLHPLSNNNRLQRRTTLDLFVMVPLDRCTFIRFLGEWFAGDAILAFDPLAEVDELAPLRPEGTKSIVFPLD